MNKTKYTPLAILFHWLTALGIFVCFPLGLYMSDLALSPRKLQLISYHKWLGVTIFAILVFRIIWRFFHQPPALPESMPAWQITASNLTHIALYFFMIAVPLSGWIMSSAKGFTTVYLGIFPLPDLISKDTVLAESLVDVHEFLNYALLLLVLLHIAAAIKHHFINHDSVLVRMLPWKK